jgi:hypothetical protein
MQWKESLVTSPGIDPRTLTTTPPQVPLYSVNRVKKQEKKELCEEEWHTGVVERKIAGFYR